MWCVNCRSDVATDVEPDSQRAHCANCGGEIAIPRAPSLSRTQQARELLERWAQDRAQDPFSATPAAVQVTASQPQHAAPAVAAVSEAKEPARIAQPTAATPTFRVDSGEDPLEPPARSTRPAETDPARTKADGGRGSHRIDATHDTPAPHVAFPTIAQIAGEKRPTKWVAVAGQSLAYIGVLGLMAGTCLVILGHFRGPETYAPTGWLITMAGQMLLFLGVVTMVSSGMEETTNTVADRIDRLGEKLLLIEQATDALRGTHFPPSPSPCEDGDGPSAGEPAVQTTRRAS
ncbi:MAG: hypothetical protein ACE5KM_20305 [Planctomycetaceae bacterium]